MTDPLVSAEPPVLVATDARGVATVTLNRPALHNAFDDILIGLLTKALRGLEADPAIRVVVLTGKGASFSAGGDLNWMRRMAGYSEAENFADAMGLALLMRTLNELAKPTVARVQGAAFAGGVGLVACCDIAIGSAEAIFSISEARLGLIPSTISPYVVAAIGTRAARRYFLSAERFSAEEARRIGLLHEVAPAAELDDAVERIVGALLEAGPQAQTAAKRLIAAVADRPVDDALVVLTARSIATARASAEAREGLAAFFDKRKPAWRG
ncbi:MAG TPA: enoyl-CoA hydratase/isomerase family protein [Stellaceae bacterium]|nr:enoyl-CoA hydratase/isomerase family protein [Stellaceae bacterium]